MTSLSTKDKFSLFAHSFEVDANGFSTILDKQGANKFINYYNNYNISINEELKHNKASKLVNKLSDKNAIIAISSRDSQLINILYHAHISACCELFRGWTIPLASISHDIFENTIKSLLSPYMNNPEKLDEIETRVHNSDSIRTAQILKHLGLISTKSENYRQLSFAAGHGNRDIDGFHAIPGIQQKSTFSTNQSSIPLTFSTTSNKPSHTVIIDNDPIFKDQYALINHQQGDCFTALNEDINRSLDILPDIIEEKKTGLINLILGLRIDHEMIPDVNDFFKKILTIMDNSADLVITIGAGHSIDEFRGRKEKIKEIANYLKKHGLSPVRIQLHNGNNLEEQRDSPSFGLLPYTTYEILYCKLKKKKLLK